MLMQFHHIYVDAISPYSTALLTTQNISSTYKVNIQGFGTFIVTSNKPVNLLNSITTYYLIPKFLP